MTRENQGRLMRSVGRVLFVLLPVVLLLALAAYLTVQFSDNLRDSRALIVRTYKIVDAAQDVLNAMQSAETGQRGYILTQRKTYLEPFEEARKELPASLAELNSLLAGIPNQQRRMATLDQLIKQKLQELQSTIDIANGQSFDAAREVILTDSGKASMDGIRAIIAEISSEESNNIESRLQASDESQRRVLIVAVG